MAYFPMFISLEGALCLVIGGGNVALRKIKTLLKYKAKILVASTEILPEIQKVIPEEQRIWLEASDAPSIKERECEDIAVSGADPSKADEADSARKFAQVNPEMELLIPLIHKSRLVIAASGDHVLNRQIGSYCMTKGIAVNVIDAPELCTFVFPSVVVRGDISIGINTGIKSPALSKQIRKQVERVIPDSYEEIALWMGELRDYVKENYETEADRRYILKTAAGEAFALDRPLTSEELASIIEKKKRV